LTVGRILATLSAMQLQKLLFEPTLARSPGSIIQWWESRRLSYNVIVGITGLATLVYVNGLELVLGHGMFLPRPGPDGPQEVWGIVAYAVLANVCYSFGSVIETVAERWLKRPVYGLGPALFRHGLVFSIGLTLLPAVLVTIANIAGIFLKP
jgi:hypothetical protein